MTTVDPAELEPEYSEHLKTIAGGRCGACGHYEADLKRAREFAHCPSCNTGTRGGNLWLRVAPGDAAAIQSLAAERDAALARVRELEGELAIEQDGHTETARSLSALEARIRELTEWRPMESAPYTTVLVLAKAGHVMALHHKPGDRWEGDWTSDELIGWLPLPEAPCG